MTVKRLIDVLQKCNENWEVYFQTEIPKYAQVDGITRPVEEVYEMSISPIDSEKAVDFRVVLREGEDE
jgi:hypothetical protein